MNCTYNYEERIGTLKAKNPFLSQSALAYMILRDDITAGLRVPGSKIIQDQLADALGISRSPVRDAIRQLSEEGLVTNKFTSGTRVYIPTIKDAKAVCEYRTAIEAECGMLAAKRHVYQDIQQLKRSVAELEECPVEDTLRIIDNDMRFHDILVCCGKNPLLIDAYRAHQAFFKLLRIATVNGSMRDSMVARHTLIIAAITSRDLNRIHECIASHLEGNVDDIIEAEKYTYE